MKISFCTFLALLLPSLVSSFVNEVDSENCKITGLPSNVKTVKVFPRVLQEEETSKFAKHVDAFSPHGKGSRQPGEMDVDTETLNRMLTNFQLEREYKGKHTLRTTRITASTSPHQDRKVADGSLADEEVFFTFLNSNKNAYFKIGDETIPVIAGDMVSFNGNVIHNTIIESGIVRLLGPFTVRDLKAVGDIDFNGNCFSDGSGVTLIGQEKTNCCEKDQVDFYCSQDADCCGAATCNFNAFTCTGYGSSGGSSGDPHILTWSNTFFDYMGQCDLVLVDAPGFAEGLGLTAQMRTKARHEYSYIESGAVRIGNGETLEVGAFGQYALNGISNAEMPSTIAGFPVTHEQKSEFVHIFKIDMGAHGSILLQTYKDLVGINFKNVQSKDFGDSIGMMGDFASGSHYARDGKTIIEDDNEFGQEWQVQKDEAHLFVTSAPEGKCILPSPKSSSSRRLGETISHEAAEIACDHIKEGHDQCVYDIIATGDLGAAQAGAF